MRLGRVEVSGSFFLFFAWLNYIDAQNTLFLTILACLFHELGHSLALKAANIKIRLIRLTCIGAQIYLERSMSEKQECFVALSGPAVNLFLAFLSYFVFGNDLFFQINLALACFNLLPIGQLDGSRILRSLFALLLPSPVADQISHLISVPLCVAVWCLGCFLTLRTGNLTLFFVSSWLMARIFFIQCKKKHK